MGLTPSRGYAVSAYLPPFKDGVSGAKIYGSNIQSGQITSAHIADGTIMAADVAAGSITSAKIGTGAVTNAKILAGAVTSAKIGAAAIATSTLIKTSAVVAAKMRYKIFTSALANSGVVYGFTHSLGIVPAFVFITSRGTVGLLKGISTSANSVGLATASAATSAKFFVAGSKNAAFTAFILI